MQSEIDCLKSMNMHTTGNFPHPAHNGQSFNQAMGTSRLPPGVPQHAGPSYAPTGTQAAWLPTHQPLMIYNPILPMNVPHGQVSQMLPQAAVAPEISLLCTPVIFNHQQNALMPCFPFTSVIVGPNSPQTFCGYQISFNPNLAINMNNISMQAMQQSLSPNAANFGSSNSPGHETHAPVSTHNGHTASAQYSYHPHVPGPNTMPNAYNRQTGANVIPTANSFREGQMPPSSEANVNGQSQQSRSESFDSTVSDSGHTEREPTGVHQQDGPTGEEKHSVSSYSSELPDDLRASENEESNPDLESTVSGAQETIVGETMVDGMKDASQDFRESSPESELKFTATSPHQDEDLNSGSPTIQMNDAGDQVLQDGRSSSRSELSDEAKDVKEIEKSGASSRSEAYDSHRASPVIPNGPGAPNAARSQNASPGPANSNANPSQTSWAQRLFSATPSNQPSRVVTIPATKPVPERPAPTPAAGGEKSNSSVASSSRNAAHPQNHQDNGYGFGGQNVQYRSQRNSAGARQYEFPKLSREEADKFPDNQQIYLQNLPRELTSVVIHEAMKRYGDVADVRLRYHANTTESRFCFVLFREAGPVNELLRLRHIQIGDKSVDVKPKPATINPPATRSYQSK